MAKLLGYLAVLLVVGPLLAITLEPLYSGILKLAGVEPEQWAIPLVDALSATVESEAFKRASLVSISAGSGILLHRLAVTVDRRQLAKVGRFDLRALRANLNTIKYGVFNPARKDEVEKALGRVVAHRDLMGDRTDIQNLFDLFVHAISVAEESARRQPSVPRLT